MPEEIEIEIVRPVNPAGVSFVKYLWGAVGARNRSVLQNYRREFSRLIQRLGFKIDEKTGGKHITGKIVIELEGDKPLRAKAVDLKVWDVVDEIKEEIVAEAE